MAVATPYPAHNLASNPALPPDRLRLLAEDSDRAVRRAVAANPATPLKAQALLALDPDTDVRAALAARAAALLPRLARSGVPHGEALALHMLEALAIDQAVNVRVALATSLRDAACVPPAIARQLARDAMRAVAEPILRHCLALSDADLVALVAQRAEPWSRAAIAGRAALAAPVADAVARSGDRAAVTLLLQNPGADLRPASLRYIVQHSGAAPDWQEALAARAVLPADIARQLAKICDARIAALLAARRDLDPHTAKQVGKTMRRRIAWDEERAATPQTDRAQAQALHKRGALSEAQIADALAWQRRDFLHCALALRAAVPEDIVTAILASQSARSVTALAWRAGLSMRCALQLQRQAAAIPPAKLLNARGGTDYPLTEVQMIWQLELFGVRA